MPLFTIDLHKKTHTLQGKKRKIIFYALRAYQKNNYNIISLRQQKKQTLQRLLCLSSSVNRVFFFSLGWMPFLLAVHSLTCPQFVCCCFQPSFLVSFLLVFVLLLRLLEEYKSHILDLVVCCLAFCLFFFLFFLLLFVLSS